MAGGRLRLASARHPVRGAGRPRRRRAHYGRKGALRGFTKAQSNAIRAAINRSDETKYIASDLLVNQRLDAAIHSPGTDMVPLVPKIAPGTSECQRVGRKVAPTKCRVDVTIGFPQDNIGVTPTADQAYANQIYVVMYVLRSKVYKNWSQFSSSTQWMNLLDNGDGTSVPFGYTTGTPPFWTADTRDLKKPIETSEFTLVKRRVVKLTKNSGMIDLGAAPGSTPNLPSTSYRGSFTYRLPKLQYDDTNGAMGGYPSNSNLFIAFGYCYADNNGTYYFDGGGNPIQSPALITVSARNHVWYKDA